MHNSIEGTDRVDEVIHNENFRCGYVAILGKPNVGKSTLLNALLDQKISIVTPKPQTTRHKILGISNGDDYQVLFLDTPGLLHPKYKLHEKMMDAARSSLDDADVVFVMLDCTEFSPENLERDVVFEFVKSVAKPKFCVFNKIDAVDKQQILFWIALLSEKYSFQEFIPISALQKIGTADLLKTTISYLPHQHPFFPTDEISDQNERFFVSEIIREKVFELCREEIPYSVAVNITEFIEGNGRDIIRAEIVVEKQSQKGIVIGKGGTMLKEIGSRARKDVNEFLGRKMHLELFVKVRDQWRKSESFLKEYGYS